MKLHLTLLRSVPPPSARCTTRTPPHALIAQRATLYTQKGDGTRVSRRQAEPASRFSLPLPCLPMVPHSLDSQPVTTHKPHNPASQLRVNERASSSVYRRARSSSSRKVALLLR